MGDDKVKNKKSVLDKEAKKAAKQAAKQKAVQMKKEAKEKKKKNGCLLSCSEIPAFVSNSFT